MQEKVPDKFHFIISMTIYDTPCDSNHPILRNVLLAALFVLSASTSIIAQTVLFPGDLAVLAVNANLNGCTGASGEDEVTFVCFKPIETGTELQLTDNGWQRRLPNRWGNAEGFVTARRTGPTIPAGAVITFRMRSIAGPNDSGYMAVAPDNGWAFTNEAFNTLNFNSGGDQLFFLQGGVWNQGTVNSGFDFQHDATYTGGTILFAFNSKNAWNDFANDPKDSGLPAEVTPCYFMAPTGGATNFISYAAPAAPLNGVTQLEWIARIANPANWTSYPDCPSFQSPPASIEILPSSMSISCQTCIGCLSLTDSLIFNLPPGGPFNLTYTDGRDTFLLANAVDGSKAVATVDQNTYYELLSVEDANGCPVYSNFEEGALLEIAYPVSSTLDSILCAGEQLLINDVIYDINNPSGTEILTARSGCDSTVSINLNFLSGPTARLLGDTMICQGEAANLTFEVDGAQMFNLTYTNDINPPVQLMDVRSGSSIEVTPTQTMTYRILSVEVPGETCVLIEDAEAVISVDALSMELIPSTYGDYNVSCADSQDGFLQARPVNGLSPYVFQWENGESLAERSRLAAGAYRLTVTDAAGCSIELSRTLTAPPPLNVTTTSIPPGCEEGDKGAIRLSGITGGIGPYEVSIDEQFFQPVTGLPFQLSNLAAGAYTLHIQDINDCRAAIPITIEAPPVLQLDLGPDQVIKPGDSLFLSPSLNFNPESIAWSPQAYLQQPDALETFAKPPRSIRYELTATNVLGCTITDQIFIEVDDRRLAYAPTAFRPDGDSGNSRFTIYGGSDLRNIQQLRIFDRWGTLVYSAENLPPNDTQSGWDGVYQGKDLESGVFVYTAVLEFSDGVEVPLQGDILLVR